MTPRWRGGWADRLELLGPLGVYAFVTLAGLTTSSVGLLSTAGTGGVAGQLGTPLRVRSDEWLTQTPIELAVLANGSSMHPPLSQAPDLIFQVSSGGPFESVLFLEGNLLRLGALLPDTMLFAAFRAFPWLLVALFLPPLLRRLGANRPLSWLAVVLCFLAPASLWWSFMPIRILGFAAAGCYLLFLARDRLARTPPDRRSRVLGLLQAALAGILLARLVSYYVPWSVTIGVPLVLATGVFLVREKELRRPALLAIGAGALVSLVVLGGTFWENAAALTAELDTVYPGLRRTTGAALTPYQLFGAPGLFGLADFPAPAVLNQSEISSAFLICAVWAAVLWGRARGTATPPQRAALLTLALATTAGRLVGHGLVGRAGGAPAAAQRGDAGAGRADGGLPGHAAALPGGLAARGRHPPARAGRRAGDRRGRRRTPSATSRRPSPSWSAGRSGSSCCSRRAWCGR